MAALRGDEDLLHFLLLLLVLRRMDFGGVLETMSCVPLLLSHFKARRGEGRGGERPEMGVLLCLVTLFDLEGRGGRGADTFNGRERFGVLNRCCNGRKKACLLPEFIAGMSWHRFGEDSPGRRRFPRQVSSVCGR